MGTYASAQGSLRETMIANSTTNDICIGCIVELELLRVYFSWNTKADLDLHVFGPGPKGRREIYYGNRVDRAQGINDDFGAQRCDDLGHWSQSCGIRGERFTVRSDAPRVDPESDDRSKFPYCVALRTYSTPNNADPWQLVISVDGRTEWTCSGILRKGDRVRATDLNGLSPECAREIGSHKRNFGAVIELHPLRLPHRMGETDLQITGSEVKCVRP